MAKLQKLHVNPETGNIGKCEATVKDCQFAESNHYENVQEATLAAEKIVEDIVKRDGKLKKPLSKLSSGGKREKERLEKLANPQEINISKYARNFPENDRYDPKKIDDRGSLLQRNG